MLRSGSVGKSGTIDPAEDEPVQQSVLDFNMKDSEDCERERKSDKLPHTLNVAQVPVL